MDSNCPTEKGTFTEIFFSLFHFHPILTPCRSLCRVESEPFFLRNHKTVNFTEQKAIP